MLLSLNWLNRYVDLADLEATQIADDLTMCTAEVEGIEVAGAALADIVVGKVVECRKHPGADKLSLTRVQAGPGEFLQIVCGAPNIAQGQSIALCRVGVRVPSDGKGGVGKKLKKGKIRGEESQGMVCSERELGLSDAHDGILVLDTDARPGTSLAEVLPVRDTLIEIDNKSVTHRPDLWGHYGFARELAAIYGRELRDPLEGLAVEIPDAGEEVPIDIASAAELCCRYTGLVFRDVRVANAPAWMRYLLLAVGQRPVNNVVDLTNFIQLDLGQPMHAFDLARLRGPAISVRLAQAGERMTTLDGQERVLAASDLLVCDAEGPVALAGVMGGEGSMVEDSTEAVFLESAHFDASTIRRTSMRLGLRSDASARFEKSLDPSQAELAARKFVALIPEVVPGARVVGPMSDPGGWKFAGKRIPLRLERAQRMLGVALDAERVRSYLEPLGFTLHETGWDGFDVDVPSWRATKDVTIEADLIEELGRCHRYDNIEPVAPCAKVEATQLDPEIRAVRELRGMLAHDHGYFEAYNYSFLPDELCARLGLEDRSYVTVTNAIASHMTRIRRDVLPSLLGSLVANARREECLALFEVGRGYRGDEEGEVHEVDGVAKHLPHEVLQVVAARVDRRKGAVAPYARVRGELERLLARLGRGSVPVRAISDDEARALSWMHPGRTAIFHDPDNEFRVIAYAGELHPATVAALEIDTSQGGGTAALAIDVRALLAQPHAITRYQPAPKFPPQPVDLAFLVAEEVRVAELMKLCHAANPKLVRDVRLFEVYRGKGVPEGKKSCNFTVILGSDKRTLNAKDEERFITRVRETVAPLGELRG